MRSIGYIVGTLGFIFLLLYVGGWMLAWEKSYWWVAQHGLLRPEQFVLEERFFLVRFNNLYYGAEITNRFFDSVVLSWACLVAALAAMIGSDI